MKEAINLIKRFAMDETGLSTVEVILILVVLVTLVIIFREEMIEIVEDVFKAIKERNRLQKI